MRQLDSVRYEDRGRDTVDTLHLATCAEMDETCGPFETVRPFEAESIRNSTECEFCSTAMFQRVLPNGKNENSKKRITNTARQ